jgi:hypothetical protein
MGSGWQSAGWNLRSQRKVEEEELGKKTEEKNNDFEDRSKALPMMSVSIYYIPECKCT